MDITIGIVELFGALAVGTLSIIFLAYIYWLWWRFDTKSGQIQKSSFLTWVGENSLRPKDNLGFLIIIILIVIFGHSIQDITDNLTDTDSKLQKYTLLENESEHRFKTLVKYKHDKYSLTGLGSDVFRNKNILENLIVNLHHDYNLIQDPENYLKNVKKDSEELNSAKQFINRFYFLSKNWATRPENYYHILKGLQMRIDFNRSLHLLSFVSFIIIFASTIIIPLKKFLRNQIVRIKNSLKYQSTEPHQISKINTEILLFITLPALICTLILCIITLFGYNHAENMFNERVFGKYVSYFDHKDIDIDSQNITIKLLNEQSLLAVSWIQNSAEYKALAYQAFNLAKEIYDNIPDNISNPAVVVDLDETILDNSSYQASLIGTNKQYSTKTWNQWIREKKAQAIPGSVEFVKYVNNKGGTVFFISQREETKNYKNDLEQATIENMNNLGIEEVSEKNLLLKGECFKTINNEDDKSKKLRREAILSNDLSEFTNCDINTGSYNIVMLIGDNLNDFDEVKSDNEKRKKFLENHKEQLGVFPKNDSNSGIEPAYITIPNPMYGDWIDALYDTENSSKLTVVEQDTLRRKSLEKSNGISK